MNNDTDLSTRKRNKRGQLLPMEDSRRRRGHGRALRTIRRHLGLTAKEMGKELLLNQNTIYGMEKGLTVTRESLSVYIVLARRVGLDSLANFLEMT